MSTLKNLSFDDSNNALGWVTYITRGLDARVKANPNGLEIDLSTRADCNNVSKRIATDPNTANATIAEIEIAVTCNGDPWDTFTPGEIARTTRMKPLPGEG